MLLRGTKENVSKWRLYHTHGPKLQHRKDVDCLQTDLPINVYFPSNFPQSTLVYLFGWVFLVEVDKLVQKNKRKEALLGNKTAERR